MSKTRTAPRVLLAAGDSDAGIEGILQDLGYESVRVDDRDAIAGFGEDVSLCLVDLRRNGEALRMARALRARHPEAIVIGLADPARPHAAAEAIRAGVFDVLPRPPSASDLQALVANAKEQAALARAGAESAEPLAGGIIGTAPAMRGVLELVQRAAAAQCGILICGERGTGRGMIARAVHTRAAQRPQPFVKIDCSLPDPEEVEMCLFGAWSVDASAGHERRTLERIKRESRLFEASGGCLFVENVTHLSARAQARLLRVMRDREVFVDDARQRTPLSVRVIASADQSVSAALEEGRLRPDLYERLSLIRIDVPPLRQRREDIAALATHFLKELCQATNTPMKSLTRPALTLLSALPWRGNVPELKALLERLVLLVPQGLIRLEDLLSHTQLEGAPSPIRLDATLRQARERFEMEYIAAVLQHHHGRIADAARVLGIQRTNLYRKMRQLNVVRPRA